jgi:hypothetical protein
MLSRLPALLCEVLHTEDPRISAQKGDICSAAKIELFDHLVGGRVPRPAGRTAKPILIGGPAHNLEGDSVSVKSVWYGVTVRLCFCRVVGVHMANPSLFKKPLDHGGRQ